MSNSTPDDPFADIDTGRTFIMPTPGGRAAAAPAAAMPRMGAAGVDVAADLGVPDSGLNPLVALANPLLALVPQVRATTHLADPAGLRESMAQGVREFEAAARAKGIAPERVLAARYILCTLLDEVAATMPWGASGQWGRHSLLAMFHNETGGGEKVFQLMAKLAENPSANRDLLELIYAVLSLGFEGRYRVVDGGKAQLEAVRERLAQILQKERGAYAPALAQNWEGVKPSKRSMLTWLPLWVTAAVVALLLVAIYSFLSFRLSGESDPVFGRIQELRLNPPQPPVKLPAPKPRLAQFLVADIKGEQVQVRDEVDRSVVTIRGDGLFAPASASLTSEREALMKRIAEALKQVPGAVVVTGHTDNVRIRTASFPSNWHLSEERAKTVREILVGNGLPADRVRAEGRADGEPVATNDTPTNRALNRRVEITLFVTRGAGS
ncbi:DotU family type VI secretion system protein [Piscinibacter sp. HJYY11]|uniref:DotU family type VI secretion system protein n=1 Tax=Piscinibacter sp. HJYY11 TaxID=2801333 RepID=UPI00191DAAAB|nr:DotU family type VI secretion system protein [Piscinibacter sp. HJYY11]MBL0726357.1 DotU family type VI secretion system protein [Piscinibacter sp. HJYY11]